jgi:hypothetical protein
MAVSLGGETFIQRGGPPEILFAMIDALYGVKYRGQRIYPATPQNISDRDFFQQCTANLTAYMPTGQEDDDLEMYDDIYNAAREDFLNELIKPPKKD